MKTPGQSATIPIIDMSAARNGQRQQVAAELARTCEAIGFFVLTGHGIPDALVTDAQEVARAFFHLDERQKGGVIRTPPVFNRGWIPPQTEYFTRREAFPYFARNVWPSEPARLRPALTAYFAAAERLAGELMRLFALGLGLTEHWFDDKIDRQCGSLRALFYPPQPGRAAEGQLRAGAHTDYGCLTILKTEDALGGLQVAAPEGIWLDVPAVPGAFVVNLGDLMRHWTNDRWSSTLHRVVNPPPGAHAARGRLSLAFFHQPNYDAVIDCVPTCVDAAHPALYAPTTSGAHRLRKLFKANAFDAQASSDPASAGPGLHLPSAS